MAAEVRRVLIDRLEALVTDPPMQVAWENESFKPSGEGGWLDVQLFNSTTDRLFVQHGGGTHRGLGFLQVAVMAPKHEGAAWAEDVAEQIVAHFPADLRLGPVRITQRPHVAGGIPDGAWFRLPISIYFEAQV